MSDPVTQHYHHCASCRHFGFRKEAGRHQPTCTRLGFDTKPHYQFNCWDPKPRVKEAIARRRAEIETDKSET